MIFSLEPAELQAVFSALTATRAALTAVTEKLTEQYQAQTTPVPQPAEPDKTE